MAEHLFYYIIIQLLITNLKIDYTVKADEDDNPEARGTFPVINIFKPLY